MSHQQIVDENEVDQTSAEFQKAVLAERNFHLRHRKLEIEARCDAKKAKVVKAMSQLERAQKALTDAIIQKVAYDVVFAERAKDTKTSTDSEEEEVAKAKARNKRKRLEQELAKLNETAPPTPTSSTSATIPANATNTGQSTEGTPSPQKRIRTIEQSQGLAPPPAQANVPLSIPPTPVSALANQLSALPRLTLPIRDGFAKK